MLWKVLSLLLALSVWPMESDAQTPAAPCGLSNPGACRTTNNLFFDPAFEQALGRFLGDHQAAYLFERGPVRDQAIAVLGGPPDAPVLVEGLYRFTACRPHSCSEKGAVVLTPGGQIMAVAILHGSCATVPRPARCSSERRLAVFLHTDADQALIVGDLSRWAEDVVARQYTSTGLVKPTLQGVDVSAVNPRD